MGLTSSLQIGRSALAYAQAALQVTGNNMANATTPGYTRQTANASPLRGDRLGPNSFAGGGVALDSIQRHVDEAMQARIRSSLADENFAATQQNLLSQIEALHNELTDADLSSSLTRFFNAWSELANSPNDPAVRSLVVQEGVGLAAQIQDLRGDYVSVREQVDADLDTAVSRANELLTQIAQLNGSIVQAEMGQGTASSLRDQRDALLEELSSLMEIDVVKQDGGAVDVYVGSMPVVLGTQSRGVELHRETVGDEVEVTVQVAADGSDLSVASGTVGALLTAREEIVDGVIDRLDEVASTLIFEVNRVHSQGQGEAGFTELTGTYGVADSTAALNSDDADLPFEIVNGSFQLHLTHEASGTRETYRIDIDLDGIGTDTSLDSLAANINATTGGDVTASVGADGRLTLRTADGFTLSFSEDTAGVLAGLGLNTYFDGTDASDIAVNAVLIDDPSHLATGMDHVAGSNGAALGIAGLKTAPIDGLNGRTIQEAWVDNVEIVAAQANAAAGRVASTRLVRESLQAQEATVSGVSLDEEAVNLLNYQRQYQAAARFIGVIDELMNTLLSIV